MAADRSDMVPLLRKPTLRRVASRRSFAVSRRSSVRTLRQKLRSVRTKAKSVFSRSTAAPTGIDYFSTKLPAETRVQIYGYLLHHAVPLKIVPTARRATRAENLDILRVSRLIHVEALQVFYALNAICVPRAVFCAHPAAQLHPRDALNHDLVRALVVTSLAPSAACAPLLDRKTTWPAPPPLNLPCVYCDACLLPFLHSLRAMPRLRAVTLDYHAHVPSIAKLSADLAGTSARTTDLKLTCVGVGKYLLSGPWLARTRVALRDTLLAETWAALLALPRFSVANILGYYRGIRSGSRALIDALGPRFGRAETRRVVHRLILLLNFHDQGMVPRGMAECWPGDLRMDFRVVDGCGREAFLRAFNGEVQRICGEGVAWDELTGRRGGAGLMW